MPDFPCSARTAFRCGRRVALAFLMVFAPAVARAAPVRFDVPAQPASSALMAFARQAGAEVLFSFDELKQVQSNAVAGVHEPAEAIALLLRGTGFKAMLSSGGKFVVVAERPRRQAGGVQGRVLIATDDGPLAGAWVALADGSAAVRTGSDGTFVLPDLPIGMHSLVVQADGYVPVRIARVAVAPSTTMELGTVRLRKGDGVEQLEEIVVNATMLNGPGPPPLLLEEVVVTPSRFALEEERGFVAATLTESDLLALPQLGDDLYRAISHLPGLAADDMTARFWVRGAPHDQVLARLDGVTLIEPFHMQDTDSSLSILDLEAISRLDLLTGGFTAEFGDRLAGVLTMETDRHVRPKPRTTLGLSLTGARVASRGATASGRSRWLMSARTGYPQVALKVRNASDSADLEPRYYDVFAKWETNLTPNQTLAVHALLASDRMQFDESIRAHLTSRYGSGYLWARWQGDFGAFHGEAVLSQAGFSWSRRATGLLDNWYEMRVEDERALRITEFRQDWTAKWNPRVLWRAGFELRSGAAEYDYNGSREILVPLGDAYVKDTRRRRIEADPSGESWGGYVALRTQPGFGWTIEPGFRYDANNYAHDSDPSPRFNAAWTRAATTLRVGWGIFHQSQPLHRLAVVDGETDFGASERAEHRVVSLEHRLPAGVNLRIEGYERDVDRPMPHWENVVETLDAVPEQVYDRLRLDPVRQRARGLEVIAERRGRRLAWSASYGLSRSEETLRDGPTVPRARDQRHTVYVDATYTPNPRWQFSLAWQYHSGWPTTELDFRLVPYAGGGSVIVPDLRTPFAEKLPAYQRFDLRVQRRFQLRRSTLRVYLDVFNLFDRENLISYGHDVTVHPDNSMTVKRRNGDRLMPLIPSVGVTWDF